MKTNLIKVQSAVSLCSEACWTIALQVRRLNSQEPEDNIFLFRWWADLKFLIISLYELRRVTEVASKQPLVRRNIKQAIKEFDRTLPNLKKMRNVMAHLDNYALDQPDRSNKDINHKHIQSGHWDGQVFKWLGVELDIKEAMIASGKLFQAVKKAEEKYKMDYGKEKAP